MQIGHIIRKHRKEKQMTQEEMAKILGVTAPAVNKWEHDHSLPDITLLAPIARLLGINLDTLLSFQENLTNEEIISYVNELNERLKNQTYEEAFQWAEERIKTYPNCYMLIWQFAVVLNAQLMFKNIPDTDSYETCILQWFERVLKSDDEQQRNYAADSLYSYYLRKENYIEAEKYIAYFSEQNPERKRKQAVLYSKTGRTEEAWKAYEELVLSMHMTLNMTLHDMYVLALKEQNIDKACFLVEKECDLAHLFDMGIYQQISPKLEMAIIKKDKDEALSIMQMMLEHVEDMNAFTESPLFEHMIFKKQDGVFVEEMRKNLVKCFADQETFGFLKNEKRYLEIIQRRD